MADFFTATVDALIATAYSDAHTQRVADRAVEETGPYKVPLADLRAAGDIVAEMHRAWLRTGRVQECWHRPTRGKEDVYWAPFLSKYCCSSCFFFFNMMLEQTDENWTCDLCRKYAGVNGLENGLLRIPAIPQEDGTFLPVLLILFGVCIKCKEETTRAARS